MKILNQKLLNRWNNTMNSIGCEHLSINTTLSEVDCEKEYYGVKNGIKTSWMLKEARYWLSCYYETGNCRCDDRFEGVEAYKIWVSETGKLKRLIATLEKMNDILVVEWSVTRIWKVYGVKGHRQRESFNESYKYDFSKNDDVRIIEVENSDKTGTNEYSIVKITRNTYEECQDEIDGQISDGIFENCNVGLVEEVF